VSSLAFLIPVFNRSRLGLLCLRVDPVQEHEYQHHLESDHGQDQEIQLEWSHGPFPPLLRAFSVSVVASLSSIALLPDGTLSRG